MYFRQIALTLTLALVFVAPNAWSHDSESNEVADRGSQADTSGAELAIDAQALAAVAVIDQFSKALSGSDLEGAAAALDASVIILESGGVEHSRQEYLDGHAKHDAEFLQNAHVSLKRRSAHASGDLVWVASESEIRFARGEELMTLDSTETMVLRKLADGWKIVHIHWSSRSAKSAQ